MKKDTSHDRRNIGKNSGVYDVHDGQQRLVALSLFLAAIRDVLMKRSDFEDSAKEIALMIYPEKPRLAPVCRIELRVTKGNKLLYSILSRTNPDTGDPCGRRGRYNEGSSRGENVGEVSSQKM